MKRWKPWEFGRVARSLPVAKNAGAWVTANRGKRGVRVEPREPAGLACRLPSRAVPETLERVLADPGRFLVQRRREWDLLKYARLHTGETYPLGPTFQIALEDCWLHAPSGTVITSDKEVLAFSSYGLNAFYEGHSASGWEDAAVVERPAFKLATVWGRNYAHWLMDALPKADALPGREGLEAVLDSGAPRFQQETLDLLGHGPRIVPEAGLVRFRELHFVSCTRSGVPDPRPLARVRRRLQQSAGAPDGPRRIYVSRQRTRRRIVNGAEVARVLADFGFEELFPEELSFAGQVRMFSGAEAVFGAHGAGTMNAMFLPEGAALIEAFNPLVWDHAAHRVSSLFGVRHYHLFAENASRDYDVTIDPRTLARTLALATGEDTSGLLVEEKF